MDFDKYNENTKGDKLLNIFRLNIIYKTLVF